MFLSTSSVPVIGRALELYYVDGRPDGMLTAKLSNWDAKLLVVPRTRLAEALSRPETGFAGVYFLQGEQDGRTHLYIGESEAVGERIRNHDLGKDWWSSVVPVTAGHDLNKAHVRYLEARLIQEADRIGHTPLANQTKPPRPGLSEADVARMEMFIQNLLFMLPAVRVDAFLQNMRPSSESGHERADPGGALEPNDFVLIARKHGLRATAKLVGGDFVVQVGSQARSTWEGLETSNVSYRSLHEELCRSGVLVAEEGHCVFAHAYAFRSPSAAAAVVLGRQANGFVEWRTPEGLTYKEWERHHLAATGAA